jgi:2-polyprenyl-6-methoxyphenol hydroxylase-like FAD-dependent oxidoreductase
MRRGSDVVALDGIDLDIRAQEFVSILGPSGCGKSTLLQCIGGLMPVTSGSISLEGREIKEPPFDAGFVFQQDLSLQDRRVKMNARHCEIAGAGIAGLTTACVLAQRGWSVRVHERSDELREMGAGIYLKLNGLAILKELELYEQIKESGMVLQRGRITGRSGRVLARHIVNGIDTIIVGRPALHRALTARARILGVQLKTSSVVTAADPVGVLIADGQKYGADLIVGADGYRSVVRESVKLLRDEEHLQEGGIRALVPRKPNEREGLTTEQWSGSCRLGIVPCSRNELYLYLIGPANDPGVYTVPVDKGYWCKLFPQEADVLNRIADAGRYDQFVFITVEGWSSGHVAIIGDAVHAQPPNLGQGAGMAMANASALGSALDDNPDVPSALKQWETLRRPITDQVQLWSYRYGLIFYGLPFDGLLAEQVRATIMSLVGRVGFTARRFSFLRHGGYSIA